MKKTHIMAVLLAAILGNELQAQQTSLYSQYMFNMMNINPAFTGSREVPNATLLIRRQWAGLPGAPTTGNFTYDDRVDGRNHSWGAQVYYDKIGIEKTTGVQGFYSYSAPFERATLTLGLSFGMLNYSLDYRRTNPYQNGDPALQGAVNAFLPSAGFGALLSGEKWYIGFSSPALLKTKVTSDNQASIARAGADGHYFLNAGVAIPMSATVVLKPSAMLRAVKGAPLQADLNMNVWVNDLVGIGLSYRTSDAVVGLVELQLKDRLRLGYSYDYGISQLRYYNAGTHEVMLRYELGNRGDARIVSPRYF